jgi:hypothetical protein
MQRLWWHTWRRCDFSFHFFLSYYFLLIHIFETNLNRFYSDFIPHNATDATRLLNLNKNNYEKLLSSIFIHLSQEVHASRSPALPCVGPSAGTRRRNYYLPNPSIMNSSPSQLLHYYCLIYLGYKK